MRGGKMTETTLQKIVEGYPKRKRAYPSTSPPSESHLKHVMYFFLSPLPREHSTIDLFVLSQHPLFD